MAIETKSHVQRLRLPDFFHLIDSPVAFDTTDATRHMD
jgi:hypothetical protein